VAKPTTRKSEPEYETNEERRQRHMEAIDAARAKAGSLPPRAMLELERRAVEESGFAHKVKES
jgi:hypothetical protein